MSVLSEFFKRGRTVISMPDADRMLDPDRESPFLFVHVQGVTTATRGLVVQPKNGVPWIFTNDTPNPLRVKGSPTDPGVLIPSGKGAFVYGDGSAIHEVPSTAATPAVELNARADFGAVGDGVADDTIAINNWKAACASQGVSGYLPKGTYLVDAQTFSTAFAGLSFRGDGPSQSILKLRSSATDFVTIQAPSLRFTGLGIDGNSNASRSCVAAVVTSAVRNVIEHALLRSAPSLLYLQGAGVSLEDVQVEAVTSEVIKIVGTSDKLRARGIYASSTLPAAWLRMTSSGASATKPIIIEDWDVPISVSDALLLTAQQPVISLGNDYGSADVSITPTATIGTKVFRSFGDSPSPLTIANPTSADLTGLVQIQ